jgi:hypothetical protein
MQDMGRSRRHLAVNPESAGNEFFNHRAGKSVIECDRLKRRDTADGRARSDFDQVDFSESAYKFATLAIKIHNLATHNIATQAIVATSASLTQDPWVGRFVAV